jgi:hypothetical protein
MWVYYVLYSLHNIHLGYNLHSPQSTLLRFVVYHSDHISDVKYSCTLGDIIVQVVYMSQLQ